MSHISQPAQAAVPAALPTPIPASAGMAGFYVTVRTSERVAQTGFALGPYPTHQDALDQVELVRRHVTEVYRDGGWWYYGTTKLTAKPGRPLPVGRLNDDLGYGGGQVEPPAGAAA